MTREPGPSDGINRREFLALASGAVASSVVGRPLRADDLGAELPSYRVRVRRDADLLSLDFRFVNFERRDDLLHALGSGRSRVVVRFPPQNLAEARFDKAATDPDPPQAAGKPKDPTPETPAWEEDLVRQLPNAASPEPPVATYLSGPSWVVFDVPDGTTVPLNRAAAEAACGPCDVPPAAAGDSVVDLWLNLMGEWRIRIQTRATLPLKPEMPSDEETCIEVPFRLFLTPRTGTAKWITSSRPVMGAAPHSTAVEHWHAALHDRTKLVPASLPPDIKPDNLPPELAPPKNVTFQARAAFSPDYDPSGQQPEWPRFYPGKLPLSHRAVVRHGLVKQMSDGPGDGWVDAEHLVLAPLGADASLSYMMQKTFREILDAQLKNSDADKSARRAIWKHRMVVGRDTFLLSAWTGFLMPLVIPALFIEVTRRKFASRLKAALPVGQKPDPKLHAFGPPGAYLTTEYYVLAPDPVKQFAEPTSVLGLKMPIRKATLLDPKSPLIRVPVDVDPLTTPFVPRRLDGGAYVRWPVEFEDINGNTSRTDDVCLLFAANVVKGHELWPGQPDEVRRWRMPGSKVGLARNVATLQAPPTSEAQARPEVHDLAHEERDAAAGLAAECQKFLGSGAPETVENRIKELRQAFLDLGVTTSKLPPPARTYAERLRGKTRAFFNEVVTGLESGRRKAEDALNLVLAQLAGGDRLVGSKAETMIGDAKAKAAAVAGALRKEIEEGRMAATRARRVLDGDSEAIGELSQPARDAWNAFASTGLAAKVKEVAGELEAQDLASRRSVEDVLRQLERAERAAADVEMHAIEFSSRRVDKVLQQAQDIRDKLAEFTARKDFDAWLAGQAAALGGPELTQLQRELGALWTGVANWQAQKAEARRFFDGLKAEADKARAFLRDGFHPELVSADVIVPALKAMGGAAAPQELKLLEEYATKGIDGVSNSAFAHFTKVVDDGKAMANRIKCAVAAPAAQIAGLSRDLGAVVGAGQEAVKALASQAEGFDLRKAIPDFKLLGVLPFDKIVSAVLTGAEVPTINVINVPDHVEQVWEWNAKLQKIDLGIIGFEPKPPVIRKDGSKLNPRQEPVHLYIKMLTRINTPQPGQSGAPDPGRVKLNGVICYWNRAAKKPVEGVDEYYAFAIQVLKLININFVDLSFNAEYPVGGTPDFKVRPRLGEVTFLPPLDFVKKLQDALPIFGKGFDVVQEAARIGVTYQFQLPAIAFGVFSMRNLAIGSAVMFSLEGNPLRFDFNISTWKEPFELTVLCFGGRGFLKIAADTGGYRDLQGMLEFGGALSFDVVVASGGLYVMAGIYFRITTERTSVSGFLRAGGTLNVLGLVHASVEFLLMVGYVSDAGHTKLAGEASVTVSIDLFLVSFDVTIRMYKEFEGSGGSESSSGGVGALRDDGRKWILASLAPDQGTARGLAPSAARPSEAPEAYFARPQSHVDGRFSNPAEWAAQYWSQFAL